MSAALSSGRCRSDQSEEQTERLPFGPAEGKQCHRRAMAFTEPFSRPATLESTRQWRAHTAAPEGTDGGDRRGQRLQGKRVWLDTNTGAIGESARLFGGGCVLCNNHSITDEFIYYYYYRFIYLHISYNSNYSLTARI